MRSVAVNDKWWAQHPIAEMSGPVPYEKRVPLRIHVTGTRALHTDRESNIALQRRVFLRHRYIAGSYARYAKAAIIKARYILVVQQVDAFDLHGQAVGGMIGTDTVAAGGSISEAVGYAKISIPVCKRKDKKYGVYRSARVWQVQQRI